MASSSTQSTYQIRSFEPLQQSFLTVAALCTVFISTWVLLLPPTQQYEGMYGAYPIAFWMLIAIGFSASALVFLLSSIRGDGYWKLSLAFVCVIYSLYTFLPLFRGWALYGRGEADVLAHVGYTKEILQIAHLPEWNFYPGFHILLGIFNLTGFEIRSAHALFSALFMVVYIFGVYSLARQLSGNKRIAIATLFVAILPLYEQFHHTFHPAMFAFMLVPAYLFVFERYRTTSQTSYLLYAFLLSIVLVISHPVTSLYTLIILTVAVTARFLYSQLRAVSFDHRSGISILGFMGGAWVIWFSQFDTLHRRLLIALGIEDTSGPTAIEAHGTQELLLAPTIRDIVVPFIERYGPVFLIGILASITTVIVFLRLLRRRSSSAEFWLSSQYAVGVVIGVGGLVMFSSALEFDPIRNARYAILMGTLLIGFLLSWSLSENRSGHGRKWRTAIIVVALLLLMFPVAVTNTYYPHMHLTYTEADGTDWISDRHAEDNVIISHHVTAKMQMYDQGGRFSESLFEDIGENSPMPRYFGYQTHDTVGQAVDGQQMYLVTKEYDTTFYKHLKYFLQDENIVYTDEERRMLNTDPTAEKLYSNGGYTVWLINDGEAPPEPPSEG